MGRDRLNRGRMVRRMIGVLFSCAAPLFFSSCSPSALLTNGGEISYRRVVAERSRDFAFAATNRTFRFKADFEYPAEYGLLPEEHRRLVGFVDDMLNDGTNFATTVSQFSQYMFEAISAASTNEGFDAGANLDMTITGSPTFADSRYFSYGIRLHWTHVNCVHGTYDRTRGRPLKTSDFVDEGDYGTLRTLLRESVAETYVYDDKDPFVDKPADCPPIKDEFSLDKGGLVWEYAPDEMGLGSWMEVRVDWDKLGPILKKDVLMPTARFDEVTEEQMHADCSKGDSWDLPYSYITWGSGLPPSPPFEGTNYPYASVSCKLENPCRGSMAKADFDAFQRCIARVVCPHREYEPRNVREALRDELTAYWKRYLEESAGKTNDDCFGVFEMRGKLGYSGPEYASYEVMHQDGCPCCACETNVVWSWLARKPVASADFLNMKCEQEIRRLMRKSVIADYSECYADMPEVILPSYAMKWPYTFENFKFNGKGVSWVCDAGEVLIGGKGPYACFVTWEELKPCLKAGFVVPSR